MVILTFNQFVSVNPLSLSSKSLAIKIDVTLQKDHSSPGF